jgi:hypothetical protein
MTLPSAEHIQVIDELIENFNFEKVHLAMTHLNWGWVVPNSPKEIKVPTIARLKAHARHLLYSTLDCVEGGTMGSGGLEARYWPPSEEDPCPQFRLQFVLTQSDSFDLT